MQQYLELVTVHLHFMSPFKYHKRYVFSLIPQSSYLRNATTNDFIPFPVTPPAGYCLAWLLSPRMFNLGMSISD
jgi:hypothetical protein